MIKSMRKKIDKIDKEATALLEQTETAEDLEKVRVKYLGRNGAVTQLLKLIPKVALKYKPEAGKLANTLKRNLEGQLRNKYDVLRKEKEERDLAIDITMPGVSGESLSVAQARPPRRRSTALRAGFRMAGCPSRRGKPRNASHLTRESRALPVHLAA